MWLGKPPRPLPWWQEVPGNYKSRHAGNIPLLLPGNVLCPALQEAPVRSQPGSQPASQPAAAADAAAAAAAQGQTRRGTPAGARAALASRRRAGRSVAAAGLSSGWDWSGTRPDRCGDGLCARERVAERLGEVVRRALDRCPLPRGAGAPRAWGALAAPNPG